MARNEKRIAVLEFIASHGAKGVGLSAIQKFIYERNHPGMVYGRAQRGYWCVNLYGVGDWSYTPSQGIFATFCEATPQKKWRLSKTGRRLLKQLKRR